MRMLFICSVCYFAWHERHTKTFCLDICILLVLCVHTCTTYQYVCERALYVWRLHIAMHDRTRMCIRVITLTSTCMPRWIKQLCVRWNTPKSIYIHHLR